ncbi:hypothetical protein E7T09_20775 [Deinococcus sp. KSM4-11]|uniref:hypothetical protein n=1 Tax=Deinococcus sp. KSM4-11 TaxID=2568654 RepID=UPI0010A2AEF6|nr:hypothetical protein [Deinococcus sp. KSM4-11]THF83948.1 hypothetical protein E7T09_20775 [Deinococcus sp. KSM4-11]
MTDAALQTIRAELAAQFSLGSHSLHGPAHWATVETHAVRLAALGGGDVEVCRWFAVFHDAARESEGHDTGHGARAAALVRQHRPRLPLSDAQVDVLAEACHGHELGLTSADPTIGACWDADRLDLVRVGVVPRAGRMSTDAGQRAARDRPAWLRLLASVD